MDDTEAYLADKNPEAAALFRRFQELVMACGHDVIPSVSRTTVFFKRQRVFAGAFVRGRRLEPVIDLLRKVNHPCLRGAFHTTKEVISHRFTMTSPEQLDGSIQDLLREAYDSVGPGTRKRAER